MDVAQACEGKPPIFHDYHNADGPPILHLSCLGLEFVMIQAVQFAASRRLTSLFTRFPGALVAYGNVGGWVGGGV